MSLKRGELLAALLPTLERLEGEFDEKAVRRAMKEVSPRAARVTTRESLHVTMRRLTRTGGLELVRRGSPHRPTLYRRKADVT